MGTLKYGILFCLLYLGYNNAQLPEPQFKRYNRNTICEDRGIYETDTPLAMPDSCNEFVKCAHGKTFIFQCPLNLKYVESKGWCDYPSSNNPAGCLEYQGETCYGTKEDNYGKFNMKRAGKIQQITLVHKSGYVTCDKSKPEYKSDWGCFITDSVLSTYVGTVVTRQDNSILFPFFKLRDDGYYFINHRNGQKFYRMTLYKVLPKTQIVVRKDEEIRIWWGQDLLNINEDKSAGRHCVEVYAVYDEN
ncbi:uncharacterized protein [Clytia hemisphaerica]|uniref:Chitin-binding type-2 domain-containing protein n=1 Tax=Clytia hemisphaerica TaxID=252671 RepID=A0A7M5XF30_9CNID|eukprot:TCONS_00029704-protein